MDRLRVLSASLSRLVADGAAVFRQMDAADWAYRRGHGQWSRLEILGHLVDSAVNNHQRFVRAMAQDSLAWPGYDQNAMVEVQRFGSAPPSLIVNLWESFNLYLAHLIAATPEASRGTICTIGGKAPVTLEFLMTDYVAHLQHHLRQIFEGMPVSIRWAPDRVN